MLLRVRVIMITIVFLLFNFSFFSTTKVLAATEGDYEYSETDGNITITKYTGSATELVIPSTIAGKPVTAIGDFAFKDKMLTNVTIPNSVTTIGDYAFYNNQLTNVTIPSSVTTIGDSAFTENQLTNVTIPNSVTTIGYNAFYNNQLTNVTIPSSVTTIGDSAFSCNQLTNVTIPNSVTTIGVSAFAWNQLMNVTIPSSVTTIGDYAFMNNQLTNVTFMNSQTNIGNAVFIGNNANLKLIGYNPSTAKAYAANNYLFEEYVPTPDPTPEPTPSPSTQDTASLLTGTGAIEMTVLKYDKTKPISEPLQVEITDKSGRVVTSANDKLSNGTFTSSDKLAKGSYYVTLSDGKTDQTTEVKVGTKKVSIKLVWESTLEELKDDKGAIKKSGAIKGVVYDSTGDTAKVVENATVKVVSKTTTWSTKTNKNGSFNVYVPAGTYDVIIEGKDSAKMDDKKNIIYTKVKVTAGQASSPLQQLNAGLNWDEKDKALGFSLTEASLTGKDSKTASKAFTGKALANSIVSVYTVASGDTTKIWMAETTTKKTGDFSVKVPVLAGKQVMFVVQDEAGNQYVSEVKSVPKIDAPALSASAAKGTAVGTTKIKATKTKNTDNKILVIASTTATSTPKLGDAAPTTSDSAILFLDNYESNKEISVKGATYAAVYEVSASGEIVKFKDVPLAGKIKE